MAMTPPIIKRFLISLDQNKLIGCFTFAFVVMGAGVYAIMPPPPPPLPTHKAIGELGLLPSPPIFTTIGEQIQTQGRNITPEFLTAPQIIEQIITKLNIEPKELQKRLEIKLPEAKPEGEQGETTTSNNIVLEFKDPQNATIAANNLNVVMKIMEDYSIFVNSYQLKTRIEGLEKRLEQVQQELKKAEAEYYKFISKEGTNLLAVQDGSLFAGITGSQQQQRQIQLALDQIDGQIASLEDQLGLTAKQAYTASALSADPIIASLRAQILQVEGQIELLSKDLRPEHPTMVELAKQKATNEKLLQERASEIIGTDGILTKLPSEIRQESSLDVARQQLANNLVTLQTQREGLVRQLESIQKTERELRQQYERFPEQQLEQARLAQEIQRKQGLYQSILDVLVDAQSAEAEVQGSIYIAQPALPVPWKAPEIKPKNIVLIIGAGAAVGFLAAGGVIFLLAMLDSKLHTVQELRTALSDRDVFLMGELPYILHRDEKGRRIPIILDADSVYLPFYERFRSNLRRIGESSKVVLLTSVTTEEGKSVSAYNLAIASAQAGKRTLLIEADLRSPSHCRYFNLEVDRDANNEPLKYYENRNDAIRLVPELENLYIVPSPGPIQRAAAIIESNELQQLIKDARRRFDLVVIDTPSLSSCNDALLLEPLTDGIILVTRPGYTLGNILAEVIDEFTEAELPLLGAVINGVDKSINLPIATEETAEFVEEEVSLETESEEEENITKETVYR
jgi:polysaccharide biosynthesis transport protein